MKTALGFIGIIMTMWVSTASAQENSRPSPEPLDGLNACRAIPAETERLRCFDREVALLDEAARSRNVVIIDRAGVRAAQRSLFGLRLPSLRLFGSRNERPADEPEFTSIETTVKRAERSGTGWLFTLEDDARWVQTDSIQLASDPRAGTPIRIREGALGSYRANVGNAPAIRVRRIN